MEPVAVTFVSSHAREGGSERYLQTLLQEMGAGWVQDVVVLEQGPLVEDLKSDGLDPVVIPTGPGKIAAMRSGWKLRRILSRRSPQLVHANGIKAAVVAAFALLGTRIPLLWLKHDFSFDGPLVRSIARRARRVVGVSEAVLESIENENAEVIHTGIRVRSVDRKVSRTRLLKEIGGGEHLIGLIGRLHEVKGHLELIGAAPSILRARPSARFLFIGGDDPSAAAHAREVRAEIERAGLRDRVVDLGHRGDVLQVMAALDVAVMPSVHDSRGMGREAFPLVGLELMSVGTPVVAYAAGGLPEMFGDCGVQIPLGDREALAREVVDLLSDPERRDHLSRCGRARLEESFTIDRWVEGLRRVYLEMAET